MTTLDHTSPRTLVWAHAGAAADAPSNTMEAFELALEQGADGIELDVHMTADGRVVVRHDPMLRLPDGASASIGSLTWEQVAQADVGTESFGPARVPLLADLLALLAPRETQLNVEIKGSPLPYPGMAEAVTELVERAGMAERTVYSSFDHSALLRVREVAPEASLAPLYSEAMVDPWVYAEHLRMPAVHPQYLTLLVPGVMQGYRERGIAVRAWTVDRPEDWQWLLAAQVEGIITDTPGALRAVRDRVGSGVAPRVQDRALAHAGSAALAGGAE